MANLIETAKQMGSFSTLLSLIEAAGLQDTLTSPESTTLLAPTDQAFTQIPHDILDGLRQNLPRLKKVLTYHILFGDVRSDDLAQLDEAETVEGSVVAIDHEDGVIQVNGTPITQMDILADNGVIHIIDGVLMPALVAGH